MFSRWVEISIFESEYKQKCHIIPRNDNTKRRAAATKNINRTEFSIVLSENYWVSKSISKTRIFTYKLSGVQNHESFGSSQQDNLKALKNVQRTAI